MRALLIAGGGCVPELRELACDYVDHVGEAIDLAKAYAYDAVIVKVPARAVEIVARLRGAGIQLPLLVLGQLAGPEVVRLFDAGIDSYVRLPVEPSELEAHARALVRRRCDLGSEPIGVGELRVDLMRGCAEVGGRQLDLSRLERLLLESLVLAKGRSLSKEELLDKLYGSDVEASPGSFAAILCRLRKKIRAATGGDDYITTVPGRGFVLAA